MINRGSWRRRDALQIDPSTGSVHAWSRTLSATDSGAVTALHLDAGGSTDRHAVPFGQLLVIVAGSAEVEVGGERTTVGSGDAVRWPRDVPHQLRTDQGVSALVVTYEEVQRAWRVTRVRADGQRWVVGVFADTDRAKAYRERLRQELLPGEDVVLE